MFKGLLLLVAVSGLGQPLLQPFYKFMPHKFGPPYEDAMPIGAVGIWYADQYSATPRKHIPNAVNSSVPVSANLFAAPRRLFSGSSSTKWWTGDGTVSVNNNTATAPDGTNDAASLTGSAGWYMRPIISTGTLPTGTYTIAVSAKRNTGTNQTFAFTKDNTGTRSPTNTATSVWQRFSWTFTTVAPQTIGNVFICGSDGSTAADILVCDLELYAGSSDLGPETYGGHLYLGDSAYDTRPSYASGAIDFSSVGYGLIQFPTSITFTNVTAIAVASKVTAGQAYQAFLSHPQDFSLFSGFFGISNVAENLTGTAFAECSTCAGLWTFLNKGWFAFTHRYNGTFTELFIDDIKLMSRTGGGSFSTNNLLAGLVTDKTQSTGHKIAALAIWNRALSDTEVRTAYAYLAQRAAASSITMATPRIYVAEGDSITSATVTNYPYVFGPNASPAVIGQVKATTGSGIANLVSRATKADAIIPPNKNGRKFILSVLIGANDGPDYAGGASQYASDVGAYTLARKTAGWDGVILCTILPRTAANFNTFRNSVNAIYAGGGWTAAHGVDVIADFAADATMGPDAAAANTTYYADGTHPTVTGQAILETIIRPIINGL